MKEFAVIVIGIVLMAGCTNNRVSLGDNHFRITKLPTTDLKDEKSIQSALLVEANQHCQKLKPRSTAHIHTRRVTTQTDAGADTELKNVELEYRCLVQKSSPNT